jgi:Holliday junction resolvasome RuvABC endonuclease subunit
MKIIGIDPGSRCGWAILENGVRIASGVWDLKGRRHEGGGMRYLRCRQYFEQLLATTHVDAVAYEEIRRHQGVDAAHVYGGIVGQIAAVCEDKLVPFSGIPVSTAKRSATGRGNASKDDMIAAANNRWSISVEDDNEADALWIANACEEELSKNVTP